MSRQTVQNEAHTSIPAHTLTKLLKIVDDLVQRVSALEEAANKPPLKSNQFDTNMDSKTQAAKPFKADASTSEEEYDFVTK